MKVSPRSPGPRHFTHRSCRRRIARILAADSKDRWDRTLCHAHWKLFGDLARMPGEHVGSGGIKEGGTANEDSFVNAIAPHASWDQDARKNPPNQPTTRERPETSSRISRRRRRVRLVRLRPPPRRAEQPHSWLPFSPVVALSQPAIQTRNMTAVTEQNSSKGGQARGESPQILDASVAQQRGFPTLAPPLA